MKEPFGGRIWMANWALRSGCVEVLSFELVMVVAGKADWCDIYLMLVTSQLRATAALHILLPRNPLPPQTTIFFFAAADDIAAFWV